MTNTYRVTRTLELSKTVEADSEEDAKDMFQELGTRDADVGVCRDEAELVDDEVRGE